MSKIQNTPNRAAFDVQASQDVRTQFQKDPQAGLKAAAQQFEALFLQMVLKSMRDTTAQDGLMDSEQSRFYTGMLDQQLAQNLSQSSNGVGFARLIEQQLGRHLPANADPSALLEAANSAAASVKTELPGLGFGSLGGAAPVLRAPERGQPAASMAPTGTVPATGGGSQSPASPSEFVTQLWPHAVEASRSTGIPPQFLVAHAALETGWGKSEMRRPDGSNTHNLFGIKAGSRWSGDTLETGTREFENGQMVAKQEKFRAYGSYAEAFRDYAQLLRQRYSQVIGSQDGTEFAKGLQQAGYATDPNYAEKLSGIINGPTLRSALIG